MDVVAWLWRTLTSPFLFPDSYFFLGNGTVASVFDDAPHHQFQSFAGQAHLDSSLDQWCTSISNISASVYFTGSGSSSFFFATEQTCDGRCCMALEHVHLNFSSSLWLLPGNRRVTLVVYDRICIYQFVSFVFGCLPMAILVQRFCSGRCQFLFPLQGPEPYMSQWSVDVSEFETVFEVLRCFTRNQNQSSVWFQQLLIGYMQPESPFGYPCYPHSQNWVSAAEG